MRTDDANSDAARLSLLGPSLDAEGFERPEHRVLWLAALNGDIPAHQVNGRWHFRPRDIPAIARALRLGAARRGPDLDSPPASQPPEKKITTSGLLSPRR